jgi:hypothetical protein
MSIQQAFPASCLADGGQWCQVTTLVTGFLQVFVYFAGPCGRFSGIFHLLSQIRILGAKIFYQRRISIAINHISILEPPLLIAFWPVAPEAVGQSTLAKAANRPWPGITGIQVHRGEYDRQVVEKMVEVLESGRPLLIAREAGPMCQD